MSPKTHKTIKIVDDADGIEQLLIDVECCGVASATRKYIERHRVAVDEISHALEHFHVAPVFFFVNNFLCINSLLFSSLPFVSVVSF